MPARRTALPLIDEYIRTHRFMDYINPPMGLHVRIEDRLLEHPSAAKAIPDFMDRMQAVAARAMQMYEGGPVELVNVPTVAHAQMGQLEIFLVVGGEKIPAYLVHHSGQWWIGAQEFFPFG